VTCCVLNHDGVPGYSKRPNYLGGVCQCHDSDLTHDPSSIEIICTMFEEHEVEKSLTSTLFQSRPVESHIPNVSLLLFVH
jgi:hypothetical protein